MRTLRVADCVPVRQQDPDQYVVYHPGRGRLGLEIVCHLGGQVDVPGDGILLGIRDRRPLHRTPVAGLRGVANRERAVVRADKRAFPSPWGNLPYRAGPIQSLQAEIEA